MVIQIFNVHRETKFVLQLISTWWKRGFLKVTRYCPEDIDQFCVYLKIHFSIHGCLCL